MAMLKNTEARYGAVAKTFHWLMALAIIFMLCLGLYMQGLQMSTDKMSYYGLHKSIGATILVLATLRVVWRQLNVIPKLPSDMNFIERLGAHLNHYALYFMLFAMPLLGWAMSSAAGFPVNVFGLFTMPNIVSPDREQFELFRDLHAIGARILIGLIILHVSAALFHHFWRKDNVLRRMLPW
jgi:cytochrome b561